MENLCTYPPSPALPKKAKKQKISTPDELKQHTKTLFDEFIISYTGKNKNKEILDSFVKRHSCCEYLRNVSPSEINHILGPLKSRTKTESEIGRPMQQAYTSMPYSFERTREIFHDFLMSYQPKITFRKCVNDFMATDTNLLFLSEFCDSRLEEILGHRRHWKHYQEIGNVFSETADSLIDSSEVDNTSTGALTHRSAPVNTALSFPDRLYNFMDSNPALYTRPNSPAAILGENEWIRSLLSMSLKTRSVVKTWDDVRQDVIRKHPKLSFIMKLTPVQCRTRYGALFQIEADAGSYHNDMQSKESQSDEVRSILMKTAKLQHVQNWNHVIQEAIKAHPELSYLSYMSKTQLSTRFGSFEKLCQGIEPLPLKRKNHTEEPQCDLDLPAEGLEVVGGESEIEFDGSFVPTPMRSPESAVQSNVNDDLMTTLLENPSSESPVPRILRSSHHGLFRARASTPPVLELRRSPRIKAMQSGRMSYP
jgi:hypothetical protein